MTQFYPNINKKKKQPNMYFWLRVTKVLHRLGWFRLSKFTAKLVR